MVTMNRATLVRGLLAGAASLALVGAAVAGSATAASAADDATIVPDPSWTCGAADGLAPPTSGQLVLTATLQLDGAVHDVGTTQFGHRRVLVIKGGTVKGDRVQGTVLAGGLDFELTLSNGSVELEQVNILRLSDGSSVYLRTCGVAQAGEQTVRIVPDFEVPNSSASAWLNTGKFVGTRVVDTAAKTMTLTVYDVSKVATTGTKVQLKDPAGVPNQPWECATATGKRGATVFTESVKLGSSVSVGASKRGTRNIIPITGGTTTGKVAGPILSGGADYQLIGATAKLDARYVLAPKTGEYVVVRNCGGMGSMVPTFETRADGPYAFLNTNKYLSSDPGIGSGGVTITFYERG